MDRAEPRARGVEAGVPAWLRVGPSQDAGRLRGRRGPAVVSAATEHAERADVPRTWSIFGVSSDARVTQLVLAATLLLLVTFNHTVGQVEYTQFALYLVVPVLVVVLLWREDPRTYGLGIGDWRLGLAVSGGSIAVLAVVVWFVGGRPEFVQYYAPAVQGRTALRLILDTGIELVAWEFFCRGWLLFGLARRYGADAVWLQIMPFALMHIYKPELELLSTIVGGAFFGLLAWRTRSVVYGWLVHWFILTLVMARAAGWV